MFRHRRLPFFPGAFLFISLGFALASLGGGVASVLAAIFFLPLLLLKMMFFLFIFRAFMHLAGPGRRYRGHYRAHNRPHPRERRPPTAEDREWAEAKRQAQEEVDRMFPDPQG